MGTPGEIKQTYKRGYLYETKIGKDGRAEIERQYTDHGRPWAHTVPHDHIIQWVGEDMHPVPGSPINYPDGAPEFKKYGGLFMKNTIVPANTPEQNRFKTISDFKWSIECGAEVELEWKGVHFGIVRYGIDNKITAYLWNQPDTEQSFNTVDDALEYIVGGDRLRDVITQVTVLDRTI